MMAYRMIAENESWFIDAATIASRHDEITT